MKRHSGLTLSLLSAGSLFASTTAHAEQTLRIQVDQRGDFAMIGNTLGWDCEAAAPLPLVGTISPNCGSPMQDSSPDMFWRADEPVLGQATANLEITRDQARSSSVLNLPPGAMVTHAYLYWAGRRTGSTADNTAVFEREGAFSQVVTAQDSHVVPRDETAVIYESVADVTSTVRAQGSGVYRVGGVDVQPFPNRGENVLFAGWSLVVLYQLDTDPPRNLAIFDGLDSVDRDLPSQVTLSGFLVPKAGFDAKLGAIAYEGDSLLVGDSLQFGKPPLDQDDLVADALNPQDNFFNASRSRLGVPVSSPGDLPRLSGDPNTLAGLDLDVIDVTSRMLPEQTSVSLRAVSTGDAYYLGAFITSISTFRPDFVTSTKKVSDVNGGVLLAGELLEYEIAVVNSGNDIAAATVVSDPLPEGVSFVPGSIRVMAGANEGAKTDAADTDQGSYDAATRTVTVRVGAGANGMRGGTLDPGSSSTVLFRVKVDPGTKGVISNQARIVARGERGAPEATTLTDSDIVKPGTSTTDIPVAGCMSDTDCGGSTPFCDTTQQPPVCVQCITNMQCPGPGSTCDEATHTCRCGGLPMSCMDSDDDGLSDTDETKNGTDPADKDSDDDGALDGAETTPFEDTDKDGLINALDPDSDDDGLFDGTEIGQDCSDPATQSALGHCRADKDRGATKTNPVAADTDVGGVRDGSEDANLDGVVDPEERDPTEGHAPDDKVSDTDQDGVSDPLEETLGGNPRDADSDDDGLLDGDERNPSDDTDRDGLVNLLDPDSDNDGLYDGTEAGRDCAEPATMPGHCRADADDTTTTSPVHPDSDRGGASDGSEDSSRDGRQDTDERDPTAGHGSDDSSVTDTDGDGLSDPTEGSLGSDPMDADSDDDGVADGKEANPADDADRDGTINVLDPDSDGDKLGDGTERGTDCADPATNRERNVCVVDADMGKSVTSMVTPDTDRGGVGDGIEDDDQDGLIGIGERDPNDPADDVRPMEDAGVVDAGVEDAGAPELPAPDAGFGNNHSLAGGGCSCSAAHDARGSKALDLSLFGLLGLLWWRRRRQVG